MPGYDQIPEEDSRDDEAKELMRKAEKAFTTAERYNAQKTWYLLSEFILPSHNREWFGDVSKGIRRDRRVFDTTAVQANRDLASAMHSTITNPATKWSKLRFKDDDMNNDQDGMQWLDDASDAIHNKLNESNFDSQMGRSYLSLTAMGQFILFHDEDFTFDSWHLAEVAFMNNYKGAVDTIFRRFKMTAKEAYQKFGEACGDVVCKMAEDEPLVDLDYYHCIFPRDKGKVELNDIGLAEGKKRQYASVYIQKKNGLKVKEDGFYEFPVYVSRWSNLPGETYGFGPGNVAIADIRSLNKLWEESLRALAKSVNPTIMVTKQNMISGDFRPGALTVVRDINQIKEFITQSNIHAIQFSVEHFVQSIKEGFYIDKLMLPPRTETGEMTAYEVAQRLEQMQQILGPVLSRLNSEFLSPFIMRCLKILIRKGELKPLPASCVQILQQKTGKKNQGIDLEIMFVNSLARSQQMAELRNVQEFLQETLQLSQAKPEILDKINGDAVVDYAARIRNIPEKMIVGEKQVQAIRQQKQAQQQAMQQASAGEQVSNIAKNSGQALQALGQAGVHHANANAVKQQTQNGGGQGGQQ